MDDQPKKVLVNVSYNWFPRTDFQDILENTSHLHGFLNP